MNYFKRKNPSYAGSHCNCHRVAAAGARLKGCAVAHTYRNWKQLKTHTEMLSTLKPHYSHTGTAWKKEFYASGAKGSSCSTCS